MQFAGAILVIFAATMRATHILLHIRPGLDVPRFRAMRAVPTSWWATPYLGLF